MTKTLSFLLLYFLAAASGEAAAQSGVPLRDSVPHITTTGSATLEVVPDQADIRLGVKHESPTANDATSMVATAADEIVKAVKSRDIDARDIKTNFSIAARYDYVNDPVTHNGHQVFRDYAAEANIIVRLRDVSKAGSIARELIAKGANSFQSIDFSYSREKEVRRKLDGEAIRDARDAAKTYTDAVNLTLGRVLQIGGDIQAEDNAADIPVRRSVPPTGRTAIPTEPGVQKLTESISVIWELEGKAN